MNHSFRRLLALVAICPSLIAQTLYWDTNGGLTGATSDGVNRLAPGLWDNSATFNWNANPDGTWATQGWSQGGTAVFSAGSNASGYSEYQVDIGPTVDVSSIQMEEGYVSLHGGTYNGSIYNLSAIHIGSQASLRINVALYENSGPVNLVKTGDGSLYLNTPGIHVHTTGSSTFSGGYNFVYDFTGLSTGDVTVNNGALLTTNGILDINNRTVTVSGSNSRLLNAQHVDIGDSSSATVNLQSGGYFNVTEFVALGLVNGVTGTTTVDGSGSYLGAGTDLFVGYGGTGNLTISNNGRVNVGGIAYLGYQGSGVGNLTLASGGTLAVGGTNGIQKGSGSASLTLSGGAIEATGSNLTTSLPITLTSGTTSTINTNGLAVDLTGAISGTGGLAKSGTGDLYLSSITSGNEFEYLVFNGGTAYLNGAAPTIGTAVFNGGTFANGSVENASAYEVQTGSLSLALGGSAGLTKTGSGTFTLSGANTYSGDTTVSDGTLVFATPANLGSGNVIATGSNSILAPSGSLTINESRSVSLNNGGTLQVGGASGLALSGGASLYLNGGVLQVVTSDLSSSAATFINLGTSTASTVDTNGFNATLNGSIDGAGSLIKSGSGTLTLPGNNFYSGGTTISTGTLQLGRDNALGSTSGTLAINGGTLDLNGYNPSLGTITLSSGSIIGSGALYGSSFNLTDSGTVSAHLAGDAPLTKSGAGTVTLSGGNSYFGPTTVSAGTLLLGHNSALGSTSGALIVNGGTLNLGGYTPTVGTVTLSSGSIIGSGSLTGSNYNLTDSGSLSASLAGSASLTKSGAGTATLSGNNSHTGGTTVNAGTLVLGHGNALGDTGSNLTLNGGTLNLGTHQPTIGTAIFNGGTFTNGTLNNAAAFEVQTGSLDLALGGSATLTKTGADTFTLSGDNTFSGATTVSAGTLQLGSDSALGSTPSVDVASGATLDLNNHTITIADLDGAGNIALGSATLTTGNSGSHALSGDISGSGSLAKIGSGTLTLSGTNTYQGGTTVSAGTLTVSADANLGATSGALAVTNGATFDAGTNFQTNRAVTLDGSGTTLTTNNGELVIGSAGTGSLSLTNDASASTFNLTLGLNGGTGTVDISSGATVNVSNNTALGSASSTLNLNTGGTLSTASLGGSGTFNLAGGTLRSGGAFTSSLPANLTNASTVDTNGYATVLSGNLTGSGSLTKSGTGTLSLSGTNDYAGGTTVSTGTLSGNTTSLQGDITNEAAVVFDQAATGTYASVMSGSGSLTKIGAGNLTLSGTNEYEGGTTVSAGTLTISSDANLGATAGALAVTSGASLTTSSPISFNRTVTLDGSGTSFSNSNGELIVGHNGTGSLALTNDAIASTYNLTLAYESGTGTVDISSGGILAVSNYTSLGSASSTLNLNTGGTLVTAGLGGSGTFNLAGGTLRSNGAFSSSLPATLTNASTVDTNGHATILSGNLSGSGSLTKSGTGSLSLSGNNSYQGATTVSAGTLSVGTHANLGTGDLTVSNGAALNLSGGYEDVTNRTITVDGVGSSLAGATHLWFNRASGSTNILNVTNGGSITAGTSFSLADLGSTSVGTLNISGTGSSVSSAGIFYLGYGGQGTANVSNGGLITVGSTLNLGSQSDSSGTINLNSGGTLRVGGTNGITTGAGTANFNANGGTLEVTGSALTTTAPVTLGNATNSTLHTNGFNATLSGNITGDGSLTKSGTGTLTLSGANDYAGGTTVSAGILSGTTDSLQGNITNHAAVVFDQAATGTYAGVMSGSGSLAKIGVGNLTLSGNNDYEGGTTVSAGTLTISSDANLGASSGALTVTSGATLATGSDFRPNRVVTLDGPGTNLANNGELIIGHNGTGSLALTNSAAASAYNLTLAYTGGTGTVDISSGSSLNVGNLTSLDTASSTLNLNTGGTLTTAGLSGSGTFNLAGGTLRSGGVFTSSLPATLTNASTVDTNGHATTLSGNLTGDGSLTKSGVGNLTLSGTNSYSGGTTVAAGTLTLGAGGNTGSVGGNITNHGTVSFNRSDDHTYAGVVSDTGDLTIASGIVRFSSAQTYTGDTSIASGGIMVLSTSADQGLSASTTVNVASGGVFDFSNRALEVAGLTGSGSVYSFGGSAGHLTVNTAADQNQNFAGALGAGAADFALTKTGPGSLTLSGSNTYTGATTISGGSLVLGSATALGNTAAVNIGASGRLDLNGQNTTLAALDGAGNINLGSGSLITGDANNHSLSGNISGSGALTKSGAGTLTLSGSNTYTGPTSVNAGTLAVSTLANLGSGNIIVSGGADLTATNPLAFATSRDVTVTGAGSSLSSPGYLWFGTSGGATTHTIAVENGASITTGQTFSLADTGSSSQSTLTVTGSDSSVAATGNFYVGYAGTAIATVANGGTLSSDAAFSIATTAGSNGTLNLNAGGTLQARGPNGIAIGAGTGAFNANGGMIQVVSSDLTTSAPITLGSGTTSIIDTNGLNATFSGALSGSGNLHKTSNGTLTLSAANTFTGDTTISAGNLNLANSSGSATGTGDVTIANGAALTGTGSIGGSLNLAAGATFAPGNSAGLITIDGDFTLDSASIINLELGGLDRGTTYDAFDVTGALNLGGTLNVSFINDFTPSESVTFNLFSSSTSIGGTFAAVNLPIVSGGTWNTTALATSGQLTFTASAVPEPANFAILFGLVALVFTATRRRRRA